MEGQGSRRCHRRLHKAGALMSYPYPQQSTAADREDQTWLTAANGWGRRQFGWGQTVGDDRPKHPVPQPSSTTPRSRPKHPVPQPSSTTPRSDSELCRRHPAPSSPLSSFPALSPPPYTRTCSICAHAHADGARHPRTPIPGHPRAHFDQKQHTRKRGGHTVRA